MLVPKSVAICGSSVSTERTMAWLAKLAVARNTIARVGDRGAAEEGGNDVDSIGLTGFVPRNASHAKQQ